MLSFRTIKKFKTNRFQTTTSSRFANNYCNNPHGEYYQEPDTHTLVPRIGHEAPPFKATAVVDGQFKTVSLADYAGKYVYLFFYPLDFTFVCPTEIIDFSDRSDEFRKVNCEVVAASVDSNFSHLAWVQTPRNKGGLGALKIPILSDLTRSLSKDYGVYLEDAGHTLRGLFIIDGKGIVRHATLNDPPVGRNVDEILRLVQAYQYTDIHGEVCPSGWKPGAATIKPADKLAYFEKHGK